MAYGDNPWDAEHLYSSEAERQAAYTRQKEAEVQAFEQDHPGVWGLANTTANLPDAENVLRSQVSDYEAEQMAQEDEAVRQGIAPSPMAFAEGSGIASGAARSNAAQLRDQAGQTYQAPSAPNPVYPIRQEHAQTYENLAGQQHEAKDLTAQAAIYQQSSEADAYEREAGRQQAQIDGQQAKLIRDQQRREQAMEAERHVFEQIQNASDKLVKTPDQDRGRYWASRKWWQKALWAISAIGDSVRGLDPMAALNSAIEGDIRDQAANYGARKDNLDAARAQLGDVRSLYADLRSTIGDEDTTHDAMRLARYEQAKAMIMAEQLRNGIPLQAALANEGILELDQKINDTTELIRSRLATTPERIGGGTRYVLPAEQRRSLNKRADAEDAHARALQMKGIDVGAGAASQERAGQIDIEKEQAKHGPGAPKEAAQRRIDVDQAKWLTEKVEPFRNEERMIAKYLETYKDEIPGLVFGLGWQKKLRTDDMIRAKERLKRIVMVRLRRESGAAISEKELSNDADSLLEAMDEDDVRNMLQDRLEEARARIDYFERAPEEQTVERVNRAKGAERAPIASGGSGLPDVFDEYGDE